MSEARGEILSRIRRALKRGRLDPQSAAEFRVRLTAHRRNPLPSRATKLDHAGRVELFVSMAEEVQATVTRVTSLAMVPEAVARDVAG